MFGLRVISPTPLHLVDAFPTQHSFDLSSSSRQVDSRHPHSFPTQCHLTFTLLRQVYSQRLIGLATAVGRSPIAYPPRSMCLSLPFLILYISVCPLCLIACYPSSVFSVSSSVPPSPLTLVLSIFILTSIDPTLVIPYFPYEPFSIIQINPILTTPALV